MSNLIWKKFFTDGSIIASSNQELSFKSTRLNGLYSVLVELYNQQIIFSCGEGDWKLRLGCVSTYNPDRSLPTEIIDCKIQRKFQYYDYGKILYIIEKPNKFLVISESRPLYNEYLLDCIQINESYNNMWLIGEITQNGSRIYIKGGNYVEILG